jgi:hypothetical protein
MLGFLLDFIRLIWLFGNGHQAVVLENLALRQQLAIYKRKQRRPHLAGRDRWFWIALSVVWKETTSLVRRPSRHGGAVAAAAFSPGNERSSRKDHLR